MWKRGLILSGVGALLAAGVVTVMLWGNADAQKTGETPTSEIRAAANVGQTYAEALAAAKRDGIPIDRAFLNPPMPPPEQNAAPLYVQLTKLLKEKPLTEAQIAPDRYGIGNALLTKQQADKIRKALRERQDVVELIHQAASRPQFVIHRDRSVHPALVTAEEFPDYARIRNCARWLSAESALLLYDGKPLEAVKAQEMGLTVARHVTGRSVISYLVGLAVDSISLAGMSRILYEAGNDPAVAQAVREAIERSHPVLHPEEVLRYEVPDSLQTLEEIRKLPLKELPDVFEGEDITPPKFADRAAFERYVDANGITFLRLIRRSIEAMKKPYPQAIKALKAIDAEIENRREQPEYQIVWLVMTMHGTGIANHTATIRAATAVLRTGAAVLAYKGKHGSYPATLKETMTEVPSDPYSEKSLGYRVDGNRFIVYSVGSEGNFAGEFDPETRKGKVFFQYPAPAKRAGD